jgi:hypothetical protein
MKLVNNRAMMGKATTKAAFLAGAVLSVLLVVAYLQELPVGTAGYQANAAQNAGPASPPITILGSKPTTAIGIPLTTEASTQTGSALVAQRDARGLPITVYDAGHIVITTYRGDFLNGTSAIVVSVTNIGQQEVRVGRMNFGAGNSFGTTLMVSYVIGCTQDSTFSQAVTTVNNGTSTPGTKTARFVCSELAAGGPIALPSGASFAAYVRINTAQLKQLSSAGYGMMYSIAGVDADYQVFAGFNVLTNAPQVSTKSP